MGGAGVVNGSRMVAADVHATGSWLAGLELATGEVWSRRVRGAPSRVADVVAQLGPGARLIYEAGPTGFGLARAGARLGVDVVVCAPGSVPRPAGVRVKTDRRDAERLLRLWRAGELSLVRVPSPAEESFRDLVRAGEDAHGDLMRHRHRLSKFLLRRELRPPAGTLGAWSVPWMNWVRRLRFEDAAARATHVDYLAAVEAAPLGARPGARRGLATETLPDDDRPAALLPRDRHPVCLRGHRRGRRLRSLRAPRPPRGLPGIVPSEHSSGGTRRQGAITKAGSGHARRLLVEAAHHYRHPPRVSYELGRRRRGQDPRVVNVAWRAQQRLHRRWRHLVLERRKPVGVSVVALARELACFCWEAALID
jgi:transposase